MSNELRFENDLAKLTEDLKVKETELKKLSADSDALKKLCVELKTAYTTAQSITSIPREIQRIGKAVQSAYTTCKSTEKTLMLNKEKKKNKLEQDIRNIKSEIGKIEGQLSSQSGYQSYKDYLLEELVGEMETLLHLQ